MTSGPGDRGETVVRVRQIAEDRAALVAMAASAAASAARVAAEMAHRRAGAHPLGNRSTAVAAEELRAAAGSAAALREKAADADMEVARTDHELADARRVVDGARAQRKAAERFLERRRAAAAVELARRNQRTLDEGVAGAQRPA